MEKELKGENYKDVFEGYTYNRYIKQKPVENPSGRLSISQNMNVSTRAATLHNATTEANGNGNEVSDNDIELNF